MLLSACASTQNNNNSKAQAAEITVSAAASLQEAFREIGALYTKQTGAKINFNFAASGVLQQQIEQGAPVDVFASASERQTNALVEKGLIAPEAVRVFARNELVLITLPQSELPYLQFAEYLQRDNQKIAVGNPKTVPAGIYAEQTLRNLKIWEKAQSRLVFAEDVRQVLQYVARGETGLGIVYASDAKSAGAQVYQIATAPENSHEPILYPIAVVKDTKNLDAAIEFVKTVRGAEGAAILQKYGFQTIKQD